MNRRVSDTANGEVDKPEKTVAPARIVEGYRYNPSRFPWTRVLAWPKCFKLQFMCSCFGLYSH